MIDLPMFFMGIHVNGHAVSGVKTCRFRKRSFQIFQCGTFKIFISESASSLTSGGTDSVGKNPGF